MLDAIQLASARLIVDIFELLDLDPALNPVVHEDGLRYHLHPTGRFGSDVVLDVFTFGLPASESVARAQALSDGVPHWLEPFGELEDAELQIYEDHGYQALGQWSVMRRPLLAAPPDGEIPVELVTDAETEAMLAALQNAREDVGHKVRLGQYTDPRFIQCWIDVDGVAAAIGQTVIVQDCAYVCEMVTFPDYRRRGYAGAIFQALLRHAYQRGAREAILVSTSMAHGLYQSLGFEDIVQMRAFEWRAEQG